MTSAGDLSENDDFKFLGKNWHFEDDFESYEQFVFEDAWSYYTSVEVITSVKIAASSEDVSFNLA